MENKINIVDVSDQAFDVTVIQESYKRIVIVDFWAPWCGPCKTLTPLLERLADQYEGKFLLARVDSDENPDLAKKYQVRGIPNLKAIDCGEIINEFSGAAPEAQLRQFIDQCIPSDAEKLHRAARKLMELEDWHAAKKQLSEAQIIEPDNDEIRISQIEAAIALQQIDQANEHLMNIKPVYKLEDRVKGLISKLELMEHSKNAPSEKDLRGLIEQNPRDLDIRLTLSKTLLAEENYQDALDVLLDVVKIDRNYKDDIGRKKIIEVFNLIGHDHVLTKKYRKTLAALLN
jgi:putative thioredoxin